MLLCTAMVVVVSVVSISRDQIRNKARPWLTEPRDRDSLRIDNFSLQRNLFLFFASFHSPFLYFLSFSFPRSNIFFPVFNCNVFIPRGVISGGRSYDDNLFWLLPHFFLSYISYSLSLVSISISKKEGGGEKSQYLKP